MARTIELGGYTFEIYPSNSNWSEASVVYVVTHAENSRHKIIYVGETENLAQRMVNHHKQLCFEKNGANNLCLYVEGNEKQRLYIETKLINQYDPPCND